MRYPLTQPPPYLCLAALLVVSGCNARVVVVSVNSDFTQQPTPKSAMRPMAGIWQGQNESSDGRSVEFTAYVLPSGAFWASAITASDPNANRCVLLLAGTIGGTVRLVYPDRTDQREAPGASCRFADGSRKASGAVELIEGVFKIVATAEGGADASLTYGTQANASYEAPSSLSSVMGTWVNEVSGGRELIAADGTFTLQDPASGCTFSGALTILDPPHALYGLTESARECAGGAKALNGEPLEGVAIVNATTIVQLAASEQAIVLEPSDGDILFGM